MPIAPECFPSGSVAEIYRRIGRDRPSLFDQTLTPHRAHVAAAVGVDVLVDNGKHFVALLLTVYVGVILRYAPFTDDDCPNNVGLSRNNFSGARARIVSAAIFEMTVRKNLLVAGSLKFALCTVAAGTNISHGARLRRGNAKGGD